jgi:Putative transposase of IS4/5 family (DUF4096)
VARALFAALRPMFAWFVGRGLIEVNPMFGLKAPPAPKARDRGGACMTARRYELTDFEWSVIEPLLPNKPRGVPRADDRRMLNGIYWRLRSGSPWADIPERYGPATTCSNRFRRWAKIGVWDRISRQSRKLMTAICR